MTKIGKSGGGSDLGRKKKHEFGVFCDKSMQRCQIGFVYEILGFRRVVT